MGTKKKKTENPEKTEQDRACKIFYACRIVLGKTQVEMAKFLRITQGTVSKIESRDMKPEALLIFLLAKKCKLSIQAVMDYVLDEENSYLPVKGYEEAIAKIKEEKENQKALQNTPKTRGRKAKGLDSPFNEFKVNLTA